MEEGADPGGEKRLGFVNGLLFSLFIAFIGFFGVMLCFTGARAIEKQEFEWRWRAVGGIGVGPVWIGRQQAGIDHAQGADAVRIGVGFLAWGTMFIVWAVCLLLSLAPGIRKRVMGEAWGVRKSLLTLFSLVLLLVCGVAFEPPWQVVSNAGPAGFWLTVLLFFSVLLLEWRRVIRSWPRWLFPGLVVSVLVAAQFSSTAPAGIILAIFFSLFAGIHLALLVLKGRLERLRPS